MDPKAESNASSAVAPAARRTNLERQLTRWVCLLFSLILNIILRIYLWPFTSGMPYLRYFVIGTRFAIGFAETRLHQYLAGENNLLFQFAAGFLPGLLVDFGLGPCFQDCRVTPWVAQGYCKYR